MPIQFRPAGLVRVTALVACVSASSASALDAQEAGRLPTARADVQASVTILAPVVIVQPAAVGMAAPGAPGMVTVSPGLEVESPAPWAATTEWSAAPLAAPPVRARRGGVGGGRAVEVSTASDGAGVVLRHTIAIIL